MPTNLDKFKTLLEELFMFDRADLDFGIYRIMNAKRDEIRRFLDKDLLPQVKETLSQLEGTDRVLIKAELDKAVEASRTAGIDPQQSPRVKELQVQYEATTDITKIENEVFSDLTNFFRRYYSEGDFLSLRRYKEGVYAIPYEGEEVKLHWANADQYYIKSSEYFRNYTFKLADGKRVHFKIVEADTETNNNKPAAGQDRRFMLVEQEPVAEENGELVIRFEYKPDPEKRKQAELNAISAERFKATPGLTAWKAGLGQLKPTEKNPNRTLLDKHLAEYTARNTFDYFIHKDLGKFLRRELDFFIKNEVMHLDDIEAETAPKVEQYLAKIKAIRKIAHKIIDFLAQLEDFQKKLWLKKKFVVETNYCITLDRVPQELYPEIAANDAQREEWVRLFEINKIQGDLLHAEYMTPLTIDFLKQNHNLVLDTRNFSGSFKQKLLSLLGEIDSCADGVLVQSENFHALSLVARRFRNQISCIYFDPPYNTGADDFYYKDNYQHSSWLSLLYDRIGLTKEFLKSNGTLAISIDIKELDKLVALLDSILGEGNRRSYVSVKRGSVTGAKVINPGVVNISEFVVVYSKSEDEWRPEKAYRERSRDERYGLFIKNVDDDPSKWKFSTVLDAFSEFRKVPKTKLKKVLGGDYSRLLDEFVFSNAANVAEFATLDDNAISKEAVELKRQSIHEPDKVFHLQRDNKNDYFVKNGKLILFYKHRLIKIGDRLVPGEPLADIWDDVLPNDLHNEGGVELRKGKKPEKLILRVLELGSKPGDYVLDLFLGSGTSAAVAQKTGRKWIGVEQADFFDNTTKRRLCNTLYGEKSGVSTTFNWRGGGMFKYIRLESYEDTLNNLELKRTEDQQQLLIDEKQHREDYMLKYMLDVESRDSASLLNVKWFEDPFNYKLNIATGSVGETKPVNVDLVETFNYLLGLRVKHIDVIRGYKVVQGTNPGGEKVLVIWRNIKEKSNDDLDQFFLKQGYNTRDMEFDLIYVNGDNNLENLRREDETWKVRVTEHEFKRLMFETEDIG